MEAIMRRLVGLAILVLAALGGSTPAWAQLPTQISGPSPFAANCNGARQAGTVFRNAEAEPFVSTNPRNERNLVAVYQQDRWSNGAANGNLTAYSFDRGDSWTLPTPPPFSRCAGGNAANGGDYERATDPWVSFGPDGTAHQIALSVSGMAPDFSTSAILVSSSRDGGETWGPIKTLQLDTSARLFNDKESITADPTDSRYVYAVWDRLQTEAPPATGFSGDTLFARSTDGGRTWEQTRTILDFPDNSRIQSLGNQIVVLGDGTLVNVFNLIQRGVPFVAVQRSTNRGVTWSDPIIVDLLFSSATQLQAPGVSGVVDPSDFHPVRTGDLLPEAAADPRRRSNTLHIVWQDIRFTLAAPLPYFNDSIVIASSTDGGLTWSDPRRVSENKLTQAFTASVDVNARGRIGVTYYDFTFDDPSGGPLDTDYWATTLRDGNAPFSARRRLTPDSFDMRTAPDSRGFFVGDYEGLTNTGRFLPVFVTANDRNLTNRTDVFSSSFPSSLGLAASARSARRNVIAEASNRQTLARLVKREGAIQGPVRIR
jgi:hypothetical protein